jgi:hypothetical protein
MVDWQLPLVALSAVLALAYLGRRSWRTWGSGRSSCGGCGGGCTPTPERKARSTALISTEELTARLRSGRGG